MVDFTDIKRVAASAVGAALLSATCVLTAVAPARAATVSHVAPERPGLIVAELAVHSIARS